MAEQANITRALADFAANLRFEDLPPEVVHQAGRFLLDAIGCAMAAWTEDRRKAGAARAIVDDFAARGRASIIGGGRTHPALAALANGILINAADNDDTHKRALAHIGSVVVPAALGTVEDQGGDGRRLVEAVVAGYEVAARIGIAVMPTHYRFWHSTATNGTFGAAAASGRALGLDAARMTAALGFAGTQAAGLNTFFESGDDTKSLHPGKAGLNGVLGAKLAAMDVTAPPDILGHPKGYLAAYSLEPKPEALTDGLGTRWEILGNGFKFYPSILASHSPIGATLDLVTRHAPDPTEIASVEVRSYATVKSHFSSKAVETVMAARLSVPYCVAIALMDGTVTQAQFAEARFRDPAVRALLERVEIVADPDLTPLYPEKFPARVTVTMRDGTRHAAEKFYPKGDPGNPLSDEELQAKFRANAAAFAGGRHTERLIALCADLPALADMDELTALLRAA